MIATGTDEAAEDAREDAVLDDAATNDGALDATEAVDDVATLDDMAAAEDALDEVAGCFKSLLPPQPLSTTATQAAKLKVIELRKYIHSSPKLKKCLVALVAKNEVAEEKTS